MAEPAEKKRNSKASDAKSNEDVDDDDDFDLPPMETEVAPDKVKLGSNQLAEFGFTDIAGAGKQAQIQVIETSDGKKAVIRKKSRNKTVVYGADSDDDIDDTDYQPDQPYVADADISDEDEEEEEQQAEVEPRQEVITDAIREEYYEVASDADEDMWEEDETDSEEREEEDLEAEYEDEMERERQRQLKLQEIAKKKEELVDRYLKVARVMINHRKKNIYLQDYLYHLAFRKGMLRGDPPATATRFGTLSETDTSAKMLKAQEKREKKRVATMTARFARFLRKTGHFWDYDEDQQKDHMHHHHQHHHHHHHHHHHRKMMRAMGHSEGQFRNRLSRHYNVHHRERKSSNALNQVVQNAGTANHPKALPSTTVTKQDPSKACLYGTDCRTKSQKQQHKLHMKQRRQEEKEEEKEAELEEKKQRRGSRKPTSLKEILEMKAAATIKKLMKGPTDTLEVFERHRCKMAKKKQLIKIGKLLERQYAGTSLIDPERIHLISFVEESVTHQNMEKKKAMRKKKNREKEVKTMGIQHMNHQWVKSLDRIRELRLKKAKLEQEHKIQLMKKVKLWHAWEKRDVTALEGVYEFVTNMSSKVSMSKRETENFSVGLDQFCKQLNTLYQALTQQLIRLYKARSMLCMAQRKVKDSASTVSPMKGFSMADYERMIIENEESHQKLKERQENLREQHDKLRQYVEKVSDSHLKKQRTWGTLRTGRHDLKQLYVLCSVERDNLLKKASEIQRLQKRHRKFFNQVSVMGSKNCFKDFHRVHNRVMELDDKQRKMSAEVQQTETLLRVLKLKMEDAQRRMEDDLKEKREKVLQQEREFYMNTINQRINPRIPGTIYDANMMSRKSMERLYVNGERDREKVGCGYYLVAGAPSPRIGEKRPSNAKKPSMDNTKESQARPNTNEEVSSRLPSIHEKHALMFISALKK